MYCEEFFVGQRFTLSPVTLIAEEIESFARRYDPQPIHIDNGHAAEGMFGGMAIASGFHTVSAIWGEWIRHDSFGKEIIVGIGMDYITWTAPVRPGDTLHTLVEVTETHSITSSKSRHGCSQVHSHESRWEDGTIYARQGISEIETNQNGVVIMQKPVIKPPFTEETARAKVKAAEDAWNTRTRKSLLWHKVLENVGVWPVN